MNIQRYQDINSFLSEFKVILEEKEVYNTFVLLSALDIQSTGSCSFYCSVGYDGPYFVMAMICKENDYLYASTSYHKADILPMMVDHFLESNINFKGIHAYQPILNQLRDSIEQKSQFIKLEPENKVWSCMVDKRWKNPIENKDAVLKLATIENDLPLIKKWAAQFVEDLSKENHIPAVDTNILSRQSILDKSAYLLYINNVPVSMAWRRRPLLKGCAMAYVYTPKELRNKGLGAIVVSALTEKLLETYEYVTLLVSGNRDPNNNLYSKVGYKCIGEAGRLEVLK